MSDFGNNQMFGIYWFDHEILRTHNYILLWYHESKDIARFRNPNQLSPITLDLKSQKIKFEVQGLEFRTLFISVYIFILPQLQVLPPILKQIREDVMILNNAYLYIFGGYFNVVVVKTLDYYISFQCRGKEHKGDYYFFLSDVGFII